MSTFFFYYYYFSNSHSRLQSSLHKIKAPFRELLSGPCQKHASPPLVTFCHVRHCIRAGYQSLLTGNKHSDILSIVSVKEVRMPD